MPIIYSFIIPLNNKRMEQLDNCIFNIKKIYGGDSIEIIVVIQEDNKLFRRGQLINLGFKHSKGDIIIPQDVDYRHIDYFDFKNMIDFYKQGLIPRDYLIHVRENTQNNFEQLSKKKYPAAGGINCLTRDNFINSCGFSNLIYGWGPEDQVFKARAFLKVVPNIIMMHIWHPNSYNKKEKYFLNSMKMWRSEHTRDKKLDGYEQTIGILNKEEHNENIHKYYYKDIWVTDNYAYMDLLKNRQDE